MLLMGKRHSDEIIAHAMEENPNECCGILVGKDSEIHQTYRITNTVKSPYRYLMDPEEFLNTERNAERQGWNLLAFYHSHTHSAAYPSPTDVRMALQSGWLDVYYILVSLEHKGDPEMRAFRIEEDGGIVEKSLQIA